MVCRFVQTSGFTLERCDGPILTLLECDSLELLGTGWRKVMHPEDMHMSHQFHIDIHHGLGGVYRIRNVSKSGDVFSLRICTYVQPGTGLAHGTTVLEDYQLNRKHFPITNAVHRRKS